jgi:hypothetical protein
MSLLKKIDPEWCPSENKHLKVGEVISWGDNFAELVKRGCAVLVDDKGNELELPGQKFDCPICFTTIEGVMGLVNHLSTHLKKNQQVMEQITVAQNAARKLALSPEEISDIDKKVAEKTEADKRMEEIKVQRLKSLETARAAREAKVKKK